MHRIGLLLSGFKDFFKSLIKGYIGYYPRNRIFLNRYYTVSRDCRQTYDLVMPKKLSGSNGLVLCIHGGGWVEGSKDDYTGSLMQMSDEKGFACACMNYRYVSETIGFEDIMDDITSALTSIRKTGGRYGVSFDKVLLTGISAGGHLSLLYAYTAQHIAPVKPVCVVELCGPTDLENEFYYSEENSISQAVGTEYFRGIISRGIKREISPENIEKSADALRKYSPLHYVNEETVPTFFGHGEQDTIVPYQNALDLDAALSKSGVEHEFVSFPDSGHGCEDKASISRIMTLFFSCAEKYLK